VPDLPLDQLATIELRGETALQAGARTGAFEPPAAPSIERFPYYTAFPFGWYVACFSTDLAPGEVKPLRRLARDLVLWRTEDGSAVVMDAHCPHRGASLAAGGEVSGCAIVCPYHWWEWSDDGRNVSVPYRPAPVDDLRIRSYPCVEVGGFVAFWYHPDPAQEPLWELPSLEEYTTGEWTDIWPYACEYRAPWQEVAENYPDNVHLVTVHGVTIVPEVQRLDFDGYLHRVETTFTLPTGDGPVEGTMQTDAYGPGLTVMRSSSIIDSVFYLATTPIDWERTISIMGYQVRIFGDDPESRATIDQIGQQLIDELVKQWSEDIAIFDNKVHVPHLGRGAEDEAARRYRQWAQQFYVDGDPVAAGRRASGV
jgi:phenylpropionate dioxygenase-like ring-hydroxylating dioxygenase large terminal subunit